MFYVDGSVGLWTDRCEPSVLSLGSDYQEGEGIRSGVMAQLGIRRILGSPLRS